MAAVLSDIARLRRVFELELSRGCDNGAVIGGIDRLLIQMGEDRLIGPRHPLRARISALPESGYRSLAVPDREPWLRATIHVLSDPPTVPRPQGSAATVQSRPPARTHNEAPPPPHDAPEPRSGQPRPEGSAPRHPRPPTTPDPSASSSSLDLKSPLTKLPGVGKAAVSKFEKLGVESAADAVTLFPRRFNDFTDVRRISDLQPSSAPQTVVATVFSIREMRFGRRVRGAEAVMQDGSGALRVTWFNMPYVVRQMAAGQRVVLSGRVRSWRGRLQMENPEWEPADEDLVDAGRLVPVYPATQGLSQRTIRRAVRAAVEGLASRLPDPVPAWLREETRLPPLADAIRTFHYPPTTAAAEDARRRLAVGEFLAVQAAVLMRRAEWQQGNDAPPLSLGSSLQPFLRSLPFALTRSQGYLLDEILTDMRGPHPMLRLLQGDVGSGKTVIAFAAMLAAVASGHQAALMAPTEILAEQHYRSLMRFFGGGELTALDGMFQPTGVDRPVRALLLTGSLTPAQKLQIRSDAAHGGADIIIGTHALLEDDVAIPRLGLAIVDEQHRFGVLQRAKLRQKGVNPHLLVMTATPIPRTLALTVYGDLEVSTIDELPPGRKPVSTVWVQPDEREEAYQFIREHLDAGEQAFVICPLVEESEALDVRSAEEEYQRLKAGPLRDYALELLHGRMPGRMKDEIMERFSKHGSQVLVSTSVIEVGIDVPNATVIVIEGAERFGLSQLHQFRGRVGRSAMQSYCMLFSSEEDPGPDARGRLEAMVETTDGFKLAEVDLEMRGEGEAWGKVQSGANSMLRVAKLTDRDLLLQAREMARKVLARDPMLQKPEHRALAASVKPFLERATEAN